MFCEFNSILQVRVYQYLIALVSICGFIHGCAGWFSLVLLGVFLLLLFLWGFWVFLFFVFLGCGEREISGSSGRKTTPGSDLVYVYSRIVMWFLHVNAGYASNTSLCSENASSDLAAELFQKFIQEHERVDCNYGKA